MENLEGMRAGKRTAAKTNDLGPRTPGYRQVDFIRPMQVAPAGKRRVCAKGVSACVPISTGIATALWRMTSDLQRSNQRRLTSCRQRSANILMSCARARLTVSYGPARSSVACRKRGSMCSRNPLFTGCSERPVGSTIAAIGCRRRAPRSRPHIRRMPRVTSGVEILPIALPWVCGRFYYLYLFEYLYNQKIVGYEVHESESGPPSCFSAVGFANSLHKSGAALEEWAPMKAPTMKAKLARPG